jgi:hypothetical protein
MLGTYQYVLADTGRLEVISDGRCTVIMIFLDGFDIIVSPDSFV